ncbi:Putative glycosyltransferase EpsE [Acinetobacter calcoaceticus]|nr:Putative glycosyltransferase EpsE [Acinetobacter calcoaceticus]
MFITIGISIYNAELYLADAIKSIISQSVATWELILIDDGSTDNSLSIAKSFAQKDSRIRIISDGQNRKLPFRLNQIVQEAKYDYIARMDADDLINPFRLEKQLKFLEKNEEYDLVSTGILSVKNDLSLVGYRGTSENKNINLQDAILGATGIIHASIMVRKAWFLRNLYNENNRLAEDYELWLSAFLKDDLKVGFIEEPLYYYREDQNIQLNKLLQAYSTQIEIISKLSNDKLSDKLKTQFVNKFRFKKMIVKTIFLMKMDFILHRRRVDVTQNNLYLPVLLETIDKINQIEI